MDSTSKPDPPERDPREAQATDPHSGASDDPRVDPTPDERQSDTATDGSPGR